MNQRLLIGIIILVGIGSIGSVLAYSGSISAAQGNFNNVLVTGTCTGCGGGSGSFTSYSVIANVTTPHLGVGSITSVDAIVSNDGYTISNDNKNTTLFSSSGTIISNHFSIGNNVQGRDSTSDGIYKVQIDEDNYPDVTLDIFKNNISLQTIHFRASQFSGGAFCTNTGGIESCAVSISNDGHYIAAVGVDSSNTASRLIVLRGS